MTRTDAESAPTKLKGMSAFITGASRGIELALAEALHMSTAVTPIVLQPGAVRRTARLNVSIPFVLGPAVARWPCSRRFTGADFGGLPKCMRAY